MQLPLYAGLAIGENELPGGLIFAKVRSGDSLFAGRIGSARTTLLDNYLR